MEMPDASLEEHCSSEFIEIEPEIEMPDGDVVLETLHDRPPDTETGNQFNSKNRF